MKYYSNKKLKPGDGTPIVIVGESFVTPKDHFAGLFIELTAAYFMIMNILYARPEYAETRSKTVLFTVYRRKLSLRNISCICM